MKNYYEILGIPTNASLDCIKEAYRKLAKKFHPDLNQGDTFFAQHFLLIQEAYDVLSSQDKRSAFDQTKQKQPSAKDLTQEIERKVMTYRARNQAFVQQKNVYMQSHPMQKSSTKAMVIGQYLLGLIGIIVLMVCICLMINPTLSVQQLLTYILTPIKYILLCVVVLLAFIWVWKLLYAKS